jgi:glycosyltransferase involved in cell wall biosynthesis
LLLLGPQDAAVRSLLAGPYSNLVRSGRIVARDRFFPPTELASGLCAMDLVCTPYPDHVGSASIVIRAAAASRPVLGSNYGWIARVVNMFGLGNTCEVKDTNALAVSLCSALDQAPAWRPKPAAQRFVRFHSPENFAAAWTVQIRKRLGLPPTSSRYTWEWVTRE